MSLTDVPSRIELEQPTCQEAQMTTVETKDITAELERIATKISDVIFFQTDENGEFPREVWSLLDPLDREDRQAVVARMEELRDAQIATIRADLTMAVKKSGLPAEDRVVAMAMLDLLKLNGRFPRTPRMMWDLCEGNPARGWIFDQLRSVIRTMDVLMRIPRLTDQEDSIPW